MNSSPEVPRAALMARARRHFAAIAAGGLVATGALTAAIAIPASGEDSTTTDDSGTTSGTTQQPDSTTGLSGGVSGLQSDGGSNAS